MTPLTSTGNLGFREVFKTSSSDLVKRAPVDSEPDFPPPHSVHYRSQAASNHLAQAFESQRVGLSSPLFSPQQEKGLSVIKTAICLDTSRFTLSAPVRHHAQRIKGTDSESQWMAWMAWMASNEQRAQRGKSEMKCEQGDGAGGLRGNTKSVSLRYKKTWGLQSVDRE